MKCPNCGNELEEGKLLCENCGYEVKIVPDFDIELEAKLKESISVMMEDMADEEMNGNTSVNMTGDDLENDIEQDMGHTIRDKLLNEFLRPYKMKIIMIALAVIVMVPCIVVLSKHMVNNYRYNSFEYQYEEAVMCAASNNYSEAVNYLERALALNPEDIDVRFLLAKYYENNGQQQSTVSLLEEILNIDAAYEKRDEVYDMLLSIYESREEYAKINDILDDCDISRIVSKYNKYTAPKPEFNKQGGVYDELISISLNGNSRGVIHYTLDGTEPTDSSPVYETPILLEPGDYTIRAVFVNMYGIKSEVAAQHYYINLSAPDSPAVNPESGTYTEPVLVEVYRDYGTNVYYTTDGSAPNKNSFRYTDPIEMPYGISNFSFVAVDESGLGSEIVKRTYHLEIQANFDAELALQVLLNYLCAAGKLMDVDGSVPNKPGINQYTIRTLFKAGDTVYYIVYEEYVDVAGEAQDTNDIYAVDVNTANLYQAYKIDEGKYNLQPLTESLQ